MYIQEFTTKTFIVKDKTIFRPRIHCKDGFSMSVQASRHHHCQPKKTQENYTSMEIKLPSEDESLLFDFAKILNDCTGTIYAYVPNEVINNVIDKHGGIDIDKTFKRGFSR